MLEGTTSHTCAPGDAQDSAACSSLWGGPEISGKSYPENYALFRDGTAVLNEGKHLKVVKVVKVVKAVTRPVPGSASLILGRTGWSGLGTAFRRAE
jgi:hypothetical protein